MSPLANSYNALANLNQQPEYQCLWEPFGVDPASAAAITLPTAAGSVGWVPGCLLAYNTAGVGAYPGPGGDSGGSGNPNFPYNWTVQVVDPAPTSSVIYLAGVLLGVGALGAPAPSVPNTISGAGTGQPALQAMVGVRGLCQVYVDNTTTIGHTLKCSTTHIGNASDTGGNTFTLGTTFGIALQAVTITAGPKLCWAHVCFP